MHLCKFNYIVKEHFPKNYPVDIINLISDFVCDCNGIKCDFCKEYYSSCYLKRCANCKKRTCGLENCLNYPVDYLVTYSKLHKVIKCCHKCPECKDL